MVGRIYKEDTLLHAKYKNSGPCGFGEEFVIFFSHDALGSWPVWTPGIYKDDLYTLLNTNVKASRGPLDFGKYIFFMFSHGKSMAANYPRNGAKFDPWGMVGRINKGDYYTFLQKIICKLCALWLCFFYVFLL